MQHPPLPSTSTDPHGGLVPSGIEFSEMAVPSSNDSGIGQYRDQGLLPTQQEPSQQQQQHYSSSAHSSLNGFPHPSTYPTVVPHDPQSPTRSLPLHARALASGASQDPVPLPNTPFAAMQTPLSSVPGMHDPVTEWSYEMRREAQEVLPGLFVGPYQASRSKESLTAKGITSIVCISERREQHLVKARFPETFDYLCLEVRDAQDQNLIRVFPQAKAFIDDALYKGGKVLVHCGDGISRSPAIV